MGFDSQNDCTGLDAQSTGFYLQHHISWVWWSRQEKPKFKVIPSYTLNLNVISSAGYTRFCLKEKKGVSIIL